MLQLLEILIVVDNHLIVGIQVSSLSNCRSVVFPGIGMLQLLDYLN